MKNLVQKFGGSSLKNIDCLQQVAHKINNGLQRVSKICVVVSAMGNTTNELFSLFRSVSRKHHPRELDMMLTTGEQISASLVSVLLQDKGIKSIALNSFQTGITTTDHHNNALIESINIDTIQNNFRNHNVVIIPGFQGVTKDQEITTLGRGGSDTTAVAIAVSLNAPCEIYSDVKGVYTVNPKLYPKAKKLPYIQYEEMLEMARQGAEVLHDRSIEIASRFSTPIYCASTFSEERGTMICDSIEIFNEKPVTGLSVRDKQVLLNYKLKKEYSRSSLEILTKKLEDKSLNIDMIALEQNLSMTMVSITFSNHQNEKIMENLLTIRKELNLSEMDFYFEDCFSKITLVGSNMRKLRGVASSLFQCIDPHLISLITTSEISISLLTKSNNQDKMIQSLAKEFAL